MGVEAHYLWNWTPQKEPIVSSLVLAQKGKGSAKALRQWIEYALSCGPLPQADVIIPCPARTSSRRHSMKLAHELSRILNYPVADCLCYGSQSPIAKQQTLTREDRSKVIMSYKSHSQADFTKGKRILFVDDVITTGSTMVAASRALFPFVEFSAWALAYRQ
jgi:predicted amidophosphoribosyltransferase